MSFLSLKIWAVIPQNIKDSSSLPCFKKSIGKWKFIGQYRLCKTFLEHAGFINSSPALSLFNLFEVHVTCSCSYYIMSVQNGLGNFNYLLLQRVNPFINIVVNVMSFLIFCLIFSILNVIFRMHQIN